MTEKDRDYLRIIYKLDDAHIALAGMARYLKPKTAKKFMKLEGDMVDLLLAIEKESGLYDD